MKGFINWPDLGSTYNEPAWWEPERLFHWIPVFFGFLLTLTPERDLFLWHWFAWYLVYTAVRWANRVEENYWHWFEWRYDDGYIDNGDANGR